MINQYKNLHLSFPANDIVIVEINRPKELNALDTSTLESIHNLLEAVERKNQISAIIFTGGGDRAFISGGDITEMARMTPIEASNYSNLGHRVTERMTASGIVLIAAINGYALGGGLEFALACDIRIASENAVMGLPEVTLGAVCGFGGSQRLPRTIGLSKATEMLLTGRPIAATEALSWGLVSRVTPNNEELLPMAIKLAEAVTDCSPIAVRVTKRLIHQGLQMDIHSGLALEQHAFWAIFSSPDQKEGMESFLHKRPAIYRRSADEDN